MVDIDRILERARAWTKRRCIYALGGGGLDPDDDDPQGPSQNGYGLDCSGWDAYVEGISRIQPCFPHFGGEAWIKGKLVRGGWINVDSSILDARTTQIVFEETLRPCLGGRVCFPSKYRNGRIVEYGHEGTIVKVPAEWPEDWELMGDGERTELFSLVKVIDCNASTWRKRTGYAVAETTMAALWNRPDVVMMRFKGLPEESPEEDSE